MKKIIYILLITICLSGCNKSIEQSKNDTKNVAYDQDLNSVFSSFNMLDDNNFESFIGLPLSYVSKYFVGLSNYPDIKMVIAIKPLDSYSKYIDMSVELYLDSILRRLQIDYFSENNILNDKISLIENCFKSNYNGYYIYIVSDNNEEIFEILKTYLK